MSEKLRKIVADALMYDLEKFVDRHWESPDFKAMGSEIERAFATCLLAGPQLAGHNMRIGFPKEPFSGWFLVPQHEIGQFRVDFVFGRGRYPDLMDCVIVECDGHEFHDKTPEQAARDKSRDRFLNLHAKAVLRFTGREIYRDVYGCVIEALNVLHREGRK